MTEDVGASDTKKVIAARFAELEVILKRRLPRRDAARITTYLSHFHACCVAKKQHSGADDDRAAGQARYDKSYRCPCLNDAQNRRTQLSTASRCRITGTLPTRLYGVNNMQRKAFRWAGGPFSIWAELAWKGTEVMLASAQVVGHRTRLMQAAGSSPSPSDRREMQLMWQEKMEAAGESALGMTAELTRMNLQFAAQAFANLMQMSLATLALAGSASPAQSLQRQGKIIRDGIGRSMAAASTISSSSGRLAKRGLKPIHKRATRNAKRLGRRP